MRIDLRALRQPLDHLVIDLLMREHARTRRADLPGVEEDAGRRRLGRCLDIGIVEDDVGGLAAEFERHAFEIAGRAAQNSAADAGRSRERHLVDVGMIDQGVADHAAGTGDDIEDARRQAGFERQLADPQCGERGQLGRLHHDGAAAGQRRRELPHPDHQREIPGHDDGDHADRLAHRVGERIVPRGDDLAADLVGPAGVVGQRVDGGRKILPQHARRSACRHRGFRVSTISSACVFIRSTSRSRIWPRSDARMVRQGPSKARRAAATARSTSASLPSATVAMTCSVAGLRVLKVRPEADGNVRPSISSSRGLAA